MRLIWSILQSWHFFPHGVGGVERVILSFGAFEKVKVYKTAYLAEMTNHLGASVLHA
jgi:hypothetical protein